MHSYPGARTGCSSGHGICRRTCHFHLIPPLPAMLSNSVQDRYRRAVSHNEVSEDQRRRAVRRLVSRTRSYTSGCTQRLMGIGEVQESNADMLLTEGLKFHGVAKRSGVDADVLVTNSLPGSVHILTSDYLIQNGPTLLCPAKGSIEFQMGLLRQLELRPSFSFLPAKMYGGAFIVQMRVGGVDLQLVLDTGAAVAVSLSAGVIHRLRNCSQEYGAQRVTQTGVNGEVVCSDVFQADVSVAGVSFRGVEVCSNSHPVEGADGYAGLALWRCFDLWISGREVGFRPSGLPPRPSRLASPGGCAESSTPPHALHTPINHYVQRGSNP